MITIQSRIHVDRIRGTEIFDFLLNPTEHDYQRWWSGTHLQLHTLKCYPNNIGNIFYMDEFIGKYRMKMKGVVIEAVRGKKIVWQLKKIIRLPVWLSLELEDDDNGVAITHTIRARFGGIGKIFDAILRLYFSDEFEMAMDEHVKTEFPKLRNMLKSSASSLA